MAEPAMKPAIEPDRATSRRGIERSAIAALTARAVASATRAPPETTAGPAAPASGPMWNEAHANATAIPGKTLSSSPVSSDSTKAPRRANAANAEHAYPTATRPVNAIDSEPPTAPRTAYAAEPVHVFFRFHGSVGPRRIRPAIDAAG